MASGEMEKWWTFSSCSIRSSTTSDPRFAVDKRAMRPSSSPDGDRAANVKGSSIGSDVGSTNFTVALALVVAVRVPNATAQACRSRGTGEATVLLVGAEGCAIGHVIGPSRKTPKQGMKHENFPASPPATMTWIDSGLLEFGQHRQACRSTAPYVRERQDGTRVAG
jgi:hypothetical protein